MALRNFDHCAALYRQVRAPAFPVPLTYELTSLTETPFHFTNVVSSRRRLEHRVVDLTIGCSTSTSHLYVTSALSHGN